DRRARQRLAADLVLELLARLFLGQPGDRLELLARLGLRGLRLLDGGVGLLDLAVDALLFLVELSSPPLGFAPALLDLALALGQPLLALLQLGAPRPQLLVELGPAL